MGAKLTSTGIVSFFIWLACAIYSAVMADIVTRGFKILDIRFLAADKSVHTILGLLIIFSILGFFGFLVFVLDGATLIIHREKTKGRNLLLTFIFVLFGIITLPLQIFFEILTPFAKTRKYFLKIAFAILVLIFFLPAWIGFGAILAYFPGLKMGYFPAEITVAGGSMYPTFPKPEAKDPTIGEKQVVASVGMYKYPGGISILNNKFLVRDIKRGDLIVFENSVTKKITKKETGEESGFIKRAIAVQGDTIQIKDGLVYVNGSLIKEPYIAKARSTFGGNFLGDCKQLIIPKNKVFVMGDNRKGSDDSRFDVGFIDLSDIQYVLPLNQQKGDLVKGWHDPTNDDSPAARITLDAQKYLSQVNDLRQKQGLAPLTYQPKLEASSRLRGQAILKYDDFSFQATKSGYTMTKAMADAGYSNIVYGELPANGAYDAEELYGYDIEFPNTKEFLLNKDYQEMGIAEMTGDLNNCPATIVVLQMAGYVPPNYTKEQIKSWEDLFKNLKDIQNGWQDLKTFSAIYDNNKNEVDRINEIIGYRITSLTPIVARMQSNQWLTPEQNSYLKQDDALSKEQDQIANKLNSR